jgi:hypothetical protein
MASHAGVMVNSLFPLPKAFRYKVPSIVTSAVSQDGFPTAVANFAAQTSVDMPGG